MITQEAKTLTKASVRRLLAEGYEAWIGGRRVWEWARLRSEGSLARLDHFPIPKAQLDVLDEVLRERR